MRRPHGCFYVCVRAIAYNIFIHTQHASEIAGNSVALLVEIQRKLKYVQLGAARGLRQSMNQSSQFTHSTFRAACGLRQSMNRPLLLLNSNTLYLELPKIVNLLFWFILYFRKYIKWETQKYKVFKIFWFLYLLYLLFSTIFNLSYYFYYFLLFSYYFW